MNLKVKQLEADGYLLVEDGNHGEYRPLPNDFGLGTVRFIRAADMTESEVDFSSAQTISDVAVRRITKGIGKPGDIIFSHKGTVGKLALVPKDAPSFVCSPQTTFWRSLNSEVIDQEFLFYYMQSKEFTDQWMCRKGETDMADYVSLTAQRELFLNLPRIELQREIARKLSVFDRKIHANLRQSSDLERAIGVLFKSWFVDFDPVIAKAEGRKPFGMCDEIAALFPDSFEESELGSVPNGWAVRALDATAKFLNGLALQNFPSQGKSLPVIKIAQLRTNDTAGADLCSSSIPSDYIIQDGDLIFSWSGSLVVTFWTGGTGALNQHLFKVTSEQFPLWCVNQWLLQHLPEFQSIAEGKKTTMGHIKRHHLTDAKVVVPPEALIKAVHRVLEPMHQLLVVRRIENKTLQKSRATILPEMMNESDLTSEISQPNMETAAA